MTERAKAGRRDDGHWTRGAWRYVAGEGIVEAVADGAPVLYVAASRMDVRDAMSDDGAANGIGRLAAAAPAFDEAAGAVVEAFDDYYDVDDGIPNIPGDLMLAIERLRSVRRKARSQS